MSLGRRVRRTVDIWPGFVDALATLLMLIIFVLLVFVLSQFFLGSALTGKDEALSRLGQEMASLLEQLSLEKQAKADLQADLARLQEQVQANFAAHDSLLQTRDSLQAEKQALEEDLSHERQLSQAAQQQAELLSQQLAALQADLQRLNEALEAAEARDVEQKAQIADLGKRLNVALASKVEELRRYRSEFFGKLRQVLGNKPGIKIEGDRFVFQSELLFNTGSAELGEAGLQQVKSLAETLNQLIPEIPKDVNWVLRVDGHTDRQPIKGGIYASNWELSTARAISVVRALIEDGVPASRLAAAGFGEFQPLDMADTQAAYAKNRRIELRFDQR